MTQPDEDFTPEEARLLGLEWSAIALRWMRPLLGPIAGPRIVRTTRTHEITERPFTDGSSLWARVRWLYPCNETVGCGGNCMLAKGHLVPCECPGDDPGHPGTCPA